MNRPMKQVYFRRALIKRHQRPPRRLKRLLYPERVEAQYLRAIEGILAFVKRKVDENVKPMLPGLVEHFGRVRKDADEPRKYYTAFIYDRVKTPDVLHCTHKYLGELDEAAVLGVEKRIDAYFLKPRSLPRVAFDRVQFFGPDQDVRVLTPAIPKLNDFLPDLKAQLDLFRKDDFASYKPHVTTRDQVRIDRPFAFYALISKDGIHRTWPKAIRQDADDLTDLADELEKVRIETFQEYTPDELKKLARLTGQSVADWNATQMNGQLGGIVEIDLFGSGGESWLAREMGAFIQDNVDLITSIPDEYLGQVSRMVATSVRSGLRVEEIAAELEDRFEVAESRARLIARDQIGKFNGQLTELRQKDLGIETYIRRGVGDARERDSHRVLNDKKFRWDDPPEVGHPGDDYQCRCWAEPDLSGFYGDEE